MRQATDMTMGTVREKRIWGKPLPREVRRHNLPYGHQDHWSNWLPRHVKACHNGVEDPNCRGCQDLKAKIARLEAS